MPVKSFALMEQGAEEFALRVRRMMSLSGVIQRSNSRAAELTADHSEKQKRQAVYPARLYSIGSDVQISTRKQPSLPGPLPRYTMPGRSHFRPP